MEYKKVNTFYFIFVILILQLPIFITTFAQNANSPTTWRQFLNEFLALTNIYFITYFIAFIILYTLQHAQSKQ